MIDLQQTALQLARDHAPDPKNIDRIAKEVGLEAARWAFSQWQLRAAAKKKFSRADEMLFTREALEQATHEQVAKYHASRYPNNALVADLTCGIGADLIVLAARGPAIGFDLDAERVEYARHNLSVYGLSAEIVIGNSLEHIEEFDYVFVDPSRRVNGRRTLNSSEFSPPVTAMPSHLREKKIALMKLSPMLSDRELLTLSDTVEFVSFGDECREALLNFGTEFGEAGGVSAMHLESGQRIYRSSEFAAETTDPRRYFYDADPALVRAHGLSTLARELHLELLGESNGYMTSDELINSPWLRAYRVLGFMSFDEKLLRAFCLDNRLRISEIKSRASRFDAIRAKSKLISRPAKDERLKSAQLSVYVSRNRLLCCVLGDLS